MEKLVKIELTKTLFQQTKLNGRNKKTEKKQKGSVLFCSEFYGGKMKKAYVKDIVKEIKRTRKRYISIIAIVILGVAFFVGINASCPDMLNTFNKYINDYNVFDLNLISTVGFDNDDGNTEVFCFKNATATFSSFTHEPKVVKF